MNVFSQSLERSLNAPLQQSLGFEAALAHIGRPPLRLSLPGGRGEVQIIRKRIAGLRLGLISRADVPRHHLRFLAREADLSALLLNPESDEGAHGLMLRTPAHVTELDLSAREEDLRAGLHGKWRNRLRAAERNGLSLSETGLSTKQPHWLLGIEGAQARKRGYAQWPPELTQAFALANRGQARLFEAHLAGEPCAAMLFLCHGNVATYHIGWSGSEGRAACAHHALMWRAIVRLKARGVRRIDLGTVATDQSPGLARFKLGTGAKLRALGGSWIAVPRLMQGGMMRQRKAAST